MQYERMLECKYFISFGANATGSFGICSIRKCRSCCNRGCIYDPGTGCIDPPIYPDDAPINDECGGVIKVKPICNINSDSVIE